MSFPGFVLPQPPHQSAPEFYANQLRIGMTQLDFTLVFGTTEDGGPGNINSRDRATLRLSPSMAKFVLLNLQNAVEAYENAVGKIPFSPEFEAMINQNMERLTKALKEQIAKLSSTVETSTPT